MAAGGLKKSAIQQTQRSGRNGKNPFIHKVVHHKG